MADFPIPRWALWAMVTFTLWLVAAGVGHMMHASLMEVMDWYAATLPPLIYLAMLLCLDWLGEIIVGSWGIWEARRDLALLLRDMAGLQEWKMGGPLGSRSFLCLFWISLLILGAFGFLFLFDGISMIVRKAADPLNVLSASGPAMLPFWLLYLAWVSLWKRNHPNPPITGDAITAVPSLAAWRKQRLLQTQEAAAFLSLFQEACPGFSTPKAFPRKTMLLSLPAFAWHLYHWAGGQLDIPLAVSATLSLIAASSVFVGLWWLLPFAVRQTRDLLHPERANICKYLPIIRLRNIALTIP